MTFNFVFQPMFLCFSEVFVFGNANDIWMEEMNFRPFQCLECVVAEVTFMPHSCSHLTRHQW